MRNAHPPEPSQPLSHRTRPDGTVIPSFLPTVLPTPLKTEPGTLNTDSHVSLPINTSCSISGKVASWNASGNWYWIARLRR